MKFFESPPPPACLSSVSLFSGCGGLDLGLRYAGFKCLVSVDNDVDACNSIRANGEGGQILNRDIAEASAAEILQHVEKEVGEIDLLAGGPPCPPFSKSRFYRKEKPRALDDPKAETLHHFLRFLVQLQPRAFILENVPGLAYEVHRDALDLILKTATGAGYNVQYKVLNAADFGVPQVRNRIFIIGMLQPLSFQFPLESHGESTPLFARAPWLTAGEAIADLDSEENASDEGHFAGGRHHSLLRKVPPGENYLFFTAERGHPEPQFRWRSRYWSFLLKLHPDRPSWTIQARRSNNMGPFHWRNRILRLEEVKRLQTFPDDWIVTGRIDSAWRQVGNAVPPLLALRLGEALARSLNAA